MVRVAESDIPMRALIDLCHYRWGVPVLAALGESGGAKFVTLGRRLGVGAESLSRTLEGLMEQDYALRNPGYGHPMRPEYLLTPSGEAIAAACERVCARAVEAGVARVLGRKWAIPALCALAAGVERFAEIEEALPGVTPRALTQVLSALEGAGLVERVVWEARPPRVEYGLTERGRMCADAAIGLREAIGEMLR